MNKMSAILSAKKVLRNEMKECLKSITPQSRIVQSEVIYEKLISLDEYKKGKRIGVYLSMEEEVKTDKIVEHILNSGKECFIPWYDKNVMKMVKIKSYDDLMSLPFNKWNIRQPDDPQDREDAYTKGGLDVILVPGLAFTVDGARLGRGKGYYDKFINSMRSHCHNNRIPLTTIALAFKEQVVKHVPTEEYDEILDLVLFQDS